MNLIYICLSVGTSIFQFNYEPNVFLKILKHLIIKRINLVSIVCLYVRLSKDLTIWHTDLVAYTRRRILKSNLIFKKVAVKIDGETSHPRIAHGQRLPMPCSE